MPLSSQELWPSPAKLNLMLHITGRNDDGYHQLQTVFQILDYGDELSITANRSGKIHFSCTEQSLNHSNNLVVQAAKALKPYTLKESGADIILHKKLPVGGGIGGGSSNCATTLVALNQLWNCQLSVDQLAKIGLSLGADVPVFIHGNTAWGEGIGEQLTPLELPSLWYLVVRPNCFVSTAKIFSNSSLTRDSKISKIRDFLGQGGPTRGANVMEPVVTQLYPEVKEVLDWLKQHNPDARMTGSGSCVFAPFDNEKKLSKIAPLCKWSHFVARGVNRSPLFDRSQL